MTDELAHVAASGGVTPPGRPDDLGASLGMDEPGAGQWKMAWKRLRRHRLAMASVILLGIIGIITLFANVFAPMGYATLQLGKTLLPPGAGHLLGTDTLGRDELSRLIYGGRISLATGFGVAISAGLLGTFIGSLAGYYGGRLDTLLMRVTDLFLSIPLLVVLILAQRNIGGSVLDIVLVLAAFFWMPLARIVRGVFLSLKEKEFVEAARALGASNRRIIVRHMLPNALGPIIVNVTLVVAEAILIESVLSFLGFGIQPPTPTWGNMLAESRDLATTAPWLVWFPGLCILITVLCVNFFGDGLRDAFDPTQEIIRQ